jgi:hypothetical protein
MQLVEELDLETIKRLEKQSGFLRRMHEKELAEDPTSLATESSRSNLMAVQHTINLLYGEAVARDVVDLVTLTASN